MGGWSITQDFFFFFLRCTTVLIKLGSIHVWREFCNVGSIRDSLTGRGLTSSSHTASSLCIIIPDSSEDGVQGNVSRAQPYSGVELSAARIYSVH